MEDSADYSVVATNNFGQATSFANVLVKGKNLKESTEILETY